MIEKDRKYDLLDKKHYTIYEKPSIQEASNEFFRKLMKSLPKNINEYNIEFGKVTKTHYVNGIKVECTIIFKDKENEI